MPEKTSITPTPEPSLADIIGERTTRNYPQKHSDAIENTTNRRDFLVAAYMIITKRDE